MSDVDRHFADFRVKDKQNTGFVENTVFDLYGFKYPHPRDSVVKVLF